MADISVQRGTVDFSASGSLTQTITAGVDYTAPSSASAAFIRITSTHALPTGAGTYTCQVRGVWIQNGSNLLTSVTFERYVNTGTLKVAWEIVEYVGSGGGANEFIVREQTELELVSGSDTTTTGAISGIATDADVCVFITGQAANTTSSHPANELCKADWNAGADTVSFFRRRESATVGSVSYAVVEFTGSNWTVQTVEHDYDGDTPGTPATETITAVSAVTEAFAHVQMYDQAGEVNCDDYGHEVWISGTTEVSFLLESTATPSGTFSLKAKCWVIENPDMLVARYSGTHSTGTSGFTTSVTDVGALADASVVEMSATLNQTTSSTPRQYAPFQLTATDTVTGYRLTDTADLSYRFAVVVWPAASTPATSPLTAIMQHHG